MNDLYNFILPKELIAQEPASPRDSARLLVYECSTGKIVDSVFRELGKRLKTSTTIALNNSKVEHCRWLFDGGIEIFVLQKLDTNTITAMVRKGKKFQPGKDVQLTDWLTVSTVAIDENGLRTLRLSVPHDDRRLQKYEHVPMPPYIEQNDKLADEYQTVYAKPLGSKAAPTAGLHFTEELLTELSKSFPIEEITLHVGLGTFAPLTDKHLSTGKLHQEYFEINDRSLAAIYAAKHITAVGTTTVRTLETIFGSSGLATHGYTDILIRAGYDFRRVDAMITNFHLPSTSLLMLVAAFIADKKNLDEAEAAKELMRVYKHAIRKRYRFYSFGDAMLLV